MPRPAAKELTQRELEVMHIFWTHGSLTAAAARDHLADAGRDWRLIALKLQKRLCI